MADTVHRRVVVHGRVQGVFFRDSVRERARASGVAGWVSNRSDGAVEAVLEGDPEAVAQLVSFCESGPPAARVRSIDVSDGPLESLSGFAIR